MYPRRADSTEDDPSVCDPEPPLHVCRDLTALPTTVNSRETKYPELRCHRRCPFEATPTPTGLAITFDNKKATRGANEAARLTSAQGYPLETSAHYDFGDSRFNDGHVAGGLCA